MKKIISNIRLLAIFLVVFGLEIKNFIPIYALDTEEVFLEQEFVYSMDEYGNQRVTGFYYENEYYTICYDERDIIVEIVDETGNPVAQYDCNENGVITSVLGMVDNEWVPNEDSKFIGNINKMRWIGYLYDETTQCYIIDNRYYDPVNGCFTNGLHDTSILADSNPFIEQYDTEIMPMDSYYSDLAAQEWADLLLDSDTFGVAKSYSSNWYSSLSDVEIIARCIYCEGGTTYTAEENAVAWVILNRIKNEDFDDNAIDVVTAPSQFSSITGTSSSTRDARDPATETSRWRNSTYLACLMLTTTDESDWKSLAGNKINGQLYFYAYTTAKDSGTVFSGTTSNSLYKGTRKIKNVYVLGYGNVSSFDTLFSDYNPPKYSRNIYYDYD